MSDDPSLGKQIAKSYFVALVREQAHAKAEMSEISGDLGDRLKSAQDGSNLHLKAFRVVCQMNRMEEQRRNAFRDSLTLYWDFADEALWGGKHVGDLDKMARAAAAAEEESRDGSPAPVDEQVALDEQMKLNGERIASGIKELVEPGETYGALGAAREVTPEETQRGVIAAFDGDGASATVSVAKPGRGRKPKADPATHDADEPHRLRGEAAHKIGKPGIVPDDLRLKPREANLYLEGWSRRAKAVAAKNDQRGESFEDDASSSMPSVRQNERREGLPGGDAPGTYSIAQ